MNCVFRLGVAVIGLAGVCLGASPPSRLDINRLYSLPWIIGTAPQGFVWSTDSRRVAFLWNDQGRPSHDVWIASVNAGSPRRVTEMPRPAVATNPGNDLQKFQQAADAEMDPGVSHVIWSPDQKQLLFTFKGQLYAVSPGLQPGLLTDQMNVNAVKSAPKGDKIAFQAGSDFYVATVNGPGTRASQVKRIGNGPLNIEDFFGQMTGSLWHLSKRMTAKCPGGAFLITLPLRQLYTW